ncbi:toxin [Aquibacillus koreensis]|uniref:Toxin n=1 Tax=Aquibacillus koreensis TaxID=279446 RepID=A0A9X3WGV4_9BACI|nr:toxin [Aquibacillus koreensis]MCT2537322.1 toxin [Aquibacillus koreensis]MDC3418768.1 toxin [Aquibacillus koreensis]
MMKKIGKQIKVIVIILFFSFLPYVEITKPFHGIMLNQAKGYEDILQLQTLTNADLLYRIIVIPERINDPKSLSNMVERINRIDRPILEMLEEQGIIVRLFEGKLTDEPLLYYLKWDNPRGWETKVTWEEVPGSGGSWLISAKIGASMPGSGHGSINLELHEIGHTVYRLLMTDPSYIVDIQHVWNQEVNIMFPENEYFQTYATEYFSEMFAYYYMNEQSRDLVKEKTPLTYELFNRFKTLNTNNINRYF